MFTPEVIVLFLKAKDAVRGRRSFNKGVLFPNYGIQKCTFIVFLSKLQSRFNTS